MGMSEAVMLDMMGHMVVLGTALGTLMVPKHKLFTKQEAKLVTYVAGLVKSTVDGSAGG